MHTIQQDITSTLERVQKLVSVFASSQATSRIEQDRRPLTLMLILHILAGEGTEYKPG